MTLQEKLLANKEKFNEMFKNNIYQGTLHDLLEKALERKKNKETSRVSDN